MRNKNRNTSIKTEAEEDILLNSVYDEDDMLGLGQYDEEDDFDMYYDSDGHYVNPMQVDDMLDWERDIELLEKWIWVEDDEDDEPEHFSLVGVDGNIFAVMGTVGRWMREVGCDYNEVQRFYEEVKQQDSYDSALSLCIKYTDMCNELYKKNRK